MQITILGSGSRGNCIAVEYAGKVILIDVGFNAKQTELKLAAANITPESICAILITHEHSDHIAGLRVFSKRYNIPVYTNMDTASAISYKDKKIDGNSFNLFMSGQKFEVENFRIMPFSVSHDAADPLGYSVEAGGYKASFATDLGIASNMVKFNMADSDFLFIESNYEFSLLQDSERSWSLKNRIASRIGHLSNEDSQALVRSTVSPRTKFLALGHLSDDCNDPELVKAATMKTLKELNREDLTVHVAEQHAVSQRFDLEA